MTQNRTPNPKKRLKQRIKSGLTPEDVTPFFSEITSGSDRAAALVASSFLDAEIADLLENTLIFKTTEAVQNLLRGPNAPLSTFSSRIKMLHALGIIDDKLCETLETIRAIRNEFAHSFVPLRFDTPEVKELCMSLPKNDKNKWPDGAVMSDERKRFVGSCLTAAFLLSNIAKFGEPLPQEP